MSNRRKATNISIMFLGPTLALTCGPINEPRSIPGYEIEKDDEYDKW